MSVLALATIALVLVVLNGFVLGYPPKRVEPSILSAKEQAILVACADAMIPHGGALPLSAVEAGVVEHFAQTLASVPPQNRLLMRLLLRFVEHGPWIFGLEPRLTRQSHDTRMVTLEAWDKSSLYFLRVAAVSMRSLVSMAYLANPEVEAHLGATPNRDPFRLEEAP